MRVLYISDNDVTLADGLTLKNGDSITHEGQVSGGGVFVFGATFTMTGGKIENNLALIGGGVATNNSGAGNIKNPRPNNTFIMSGGEIVGNISDANNYAAGVFIYEHDIMSITGTALIHKNEARGTFSKGGGVYLNGTLTMTGGEIRENIAQDGAGVGVAAKTGVFTMDSPNAAIRNNTARGVGGGVYLGGFGDSFTIIDGTIWGNTAPTAAGVYVGTNGNYKKLGGTVQ
jgi:hypothetical protein